jgi:cysteine desulfurase
MGKVIYLDNSATTPLSDVVKGRISEVLDVYGNPSSLHSAGQEAEKLLVRAREQMLASLGVRKREDMLIFTSCGTEANSTALFGTAYAKKRREASRILTTDSEHPSVSRVLDILSEDGFEIVKIPTRDGVLDMDAVKEALSRPVFMASFMLVNNETGAHYRVEEAFELIKERYPEAVTHCDAIQGFMKVPFTPASLHADLVSVSGHKIHAPKGVGALYISAEMIKKKKIIPFLNGGGQEKGWRSGTENTIGIAALGAAAEDMRLRRGEIAAHISELYEYASDKLEAMGIRINRPADRFVKNIINITIPNIKSETVLHFLSADGVFVSSGSACSAHSHTTSSALLAFGLCAADADCSLRISLSEYNSKEDIDALCASLESAMARLVRIKR